MKHDVVQAARFDAMYQASADPWQVETRWYERRKIALLLALLPREHYESAFEPGCGAGVLTQALAPRCDRLVAADFAPHAVAATERRADGMDHLSIRTLSLPAEWPQDESFDLIVLSEWAYYLDDVHLQQLAHATAASAAMTGGDVVACHYRPDFDDRLQSTRHVHDTLSRALGTGPLVHHDEHDFTIDVWRFGGNP